MKNYKSVNWKLFAIPTFMVIAILTACIFNVNCKKGNGIISKQEREIMAFDAIDVSGAYKIILNQDSVSSVYVETDENLLPLINTTVEGGKLIIENKDSKSLCPSKNIKVYISIADIKNIDISGAVEIECVKKFSLNDLKIDASGAGDINLNLSVQNLYLDCSGASKILLSGNAENVNAKTSGASDINAFGLIADNFKISISGAGKAKVNVSKKLDVDISGAASIKYKGNPSINQNISGAGSIRKVE